MCETYMHELKLNHEIAVYLEYAHASSRVKSTLNTILNNSREREEILK